MADVSKRLGKGQTNSSTDIYQVPANKRVFIKSLTLCATSGTSVKVSLFVASVFLIYSYDLKVSETITIPFLDQIVESGESITVMADGGTLQYYMSGREVDL